MTDSLKVLGQLAPSSGSLTDLYQVPFDVVGTTVSSFVVANRDIHPTVFRMAVAIAAALDAPEQYVYWEVPIQEQDTFVATIGITLGVLDVVRVQAGNDMLSFNLFGVEVS